MKSACLYISLLICLSVTLADAERLQIADKHYLKYGEKYVALFGLGNFWTLGDPATDYKGMIGTFARDGSNLMRMSIVCAPIRYEGLDPRDILYPWARTDTPGANDGGNKFDLTKLNETFFQRVRDVCEFAETHETFIMIVLWDEIPIENNSTRWFRHPFHPQNNINDLGLPKNMGSDGDPRLLRFYDLNNEKLLSIQESTVGRLLAIVADLGNVFYTISNEYAGGEAWHRHWHDFIKRYSTETGIEPILTDELEYRDFSPDYTDLISLTTRQTGGSGNWRQNRPVVNHKTGKKLADVSESDDAIKAFWSVFANGGHTSDDSYDGDTPPNAHDSALVQTGSKRLDFHQARQRIASLRRFINSVPFWTWKPADDMVLEGEAEVMADPGRDYFIFLPQGGAVTLQLDGVGMLPFRWYQIENGKFLPSDAIELGKAQNLEPPFSGMAALHIGHPVGDKERR
ncbi:DUF6298 domain-containing protein [Candidatus Poribacteria bacterium]